VVISAAGDANHEMHGSCAVLCVMQVSLSIMLLLSQSQALSPLNRYMFDH
jgi:hypothetical protein